MFANTLDITMTTGPVTLTRVNQDNFGSKYYGSDGDNKIELVVSHQIPARGGSNESHLVRLNVEHYDPTGTYLRTSASWTVIKTFDGSQDDADSLECQTALSGLVDSTFAASLINRES